MASSGKSGSYPDFDFGKLSDFVRETMKEWKVPGTAVGVVKGDKAVFQEGFGVRGIKARSPVTPNTLFAIASCTKAFTALAVAIAMDEKKLNWDVPVRSYLPDFKLKDRFASDRITPRDLLIHNSGLPRHDSVWWMSSDSREDLVRRVRYLEPSRDFRSAWQYQNLMYMVAGYLVGKVYGTSWEDFLQKRILDPLGMENTNFCIVQSQKNGNLAHPHGLKRGRTKAREFITNLTCVGPAGIMISNVEDMCKWLRFHLSEGVTEGERIVSEENLRVTHTPQFFCEQTDVPEMPYITYCMGWHGAQFRGHRLLYHGGNVGGFSCNTAFLPEEDFGIVVLTNMSNSPVGKVVTYHLCDLLLGFEPKDWNQKPRDEREKEKKQKRKNKKKRKDQQVKGTNPSHPLEDLAGDYEDPGYGIFSVRLDQGKLSGLYNSESMPMEHYHYNTFNRVDETDGSMTSVTFHVDEKGTVSSLSIPFESNVKDIVFKKV